MCLIIFCDLENLYLTYSAVIEVDTKILRQHRSRRDFELFCAFLIYVMGRCRNPFLGYPELPATNHQTSQSLQSRWLGCCQTFLVNRPEFLCQVPIITNKIASGDRLCQIKLAELHDFATYVGLFPTMVSRWYVQYVQYYTHSLFVEKRSVLASPSVNRGQRIGGCQWNRPKLMTFYETPPTQEFRRSVRAGGRETTPVTDPHD
jgi:hypothetical protein